MLLGQLTILTALKRNVSIFFQWVINTSVVNFDVLLTVHLRIFISVFNQLDAQNLFHNKFYFMPLDVSCTCAHHQEVKIALHSLWYHHTYRCDDKTYCETNFVHQVS